MSPYAIYAEMYAALAPLVDGRCFPTQFPQAEDAAFEVWPAIRYTEVSFVPIASICPGDGGVLSLQIDVVDKRFKVAYTIRDQVVAAMQALPTWRAALTLSQMLYDDETKTHRSLMQFQVAKSSSG